MHTIDYDRAGLAAFLENDAAASTIFKSSGHLWDRTFNVFGDEVVPRASGGLWGNQATPDKQLKLILLPICSFLKLNSSFSRLRFLLRMAG